MDPRTRPARGEDENKRNERIQNFFRIARNIRDRTGSPSTRLAVVFRSNGPHQQRLSSPLSQHGLPMLFEGQELHGIGKVALVMDSSAPGQPTAEFALPRKAGRGEEGSSSTIPSDHPRLFLAGCPEGLQPLLTLATPTPGFNKTTLLLLFCLTGASGAPRRCCGGVALSWDSPSELLNDVPTGPLFPLVASYSVIYSLVGAWSVYPNFVRGVEGAQSLGREGLLASTRGGLFSARQSCPCH